MKFIQILFIGFLLGSCKEKDISNGNYLYEINHDLQLNLNLPNNAVLDKNGNSYNIISIPNGLDTPQVHFYVKETLKFTKEKDIFSCLDMEISNRNGHMLNSYSVKQGRVHDNYFITKYFKTNTPSGFYACKVQYFEGNVALFYFYDFKSETEVQKFCDNIFILHSSH